MLYVCGRPVSDEERITYQDGRTLVDLSAGTVDLHYHYMLRMAPNNSIQLNVPELEDLVDQIWYKSCSRGDIDIQSIFDMAGAADYGANIFLAREPLGYPVTVIN